MFEPYVLWMKDIILKLRSQGKSYREIQKIVKCSRSLVSYYVNPTGKQKHHDRQNKNRFRLRSEIKKQAGGKCQRCGYDKCIDALQFHHRDMTVKKFEISAAIWGGVKYTKKELLEELKKCDLVCANCHAEIHSTNDFS